MATQSEDLVRQRMYSPEEVAAIFGLGRMAVYRGIWEHTFPVEPVRIGRRWRFPRRAVNDLAGIVEEDGAGRGVA